MLQLEPFVLLDQLHKVRRLLCFLYEPVSQQLLRRRPLPHTTSSVLSGRQLSSADIPATHYQANWLSATNAVKNKPIHIKNWYSLVT